MTTLEQLAATPDRFSAEEARVLTERGKMKLAMMLPPAREGETGIIRSFKTPGGRDQWEKDKVKLNLPKTMWEVWIKAKRLANNGKGNLFGVKSPLGDSYQWTSYSDAEDRALAFGTALQRLGLRPGSDMVGVMLANGPAWFEVDIACIAYNLTTSAIYTTADDDFVAHVINNCDATVVLCNENNLGRLIRLKAAGRTITLRHIVVVGPEPRGQVVEDAGAAGLSLHQYENLVLFGMKHLLPPTPATDENTPYTIISTSGTTGVPKGSLLTHGNFVCSTYVMFNDFEWKITPSDIWFSYLPTAHVGDRAFGWTAISGGTGIAFGSGNVADLFSDLQAAKPTFMLMVPRILNRVTGMLKGMIDGFNPEQRKMFDEAFSGKKKLMIEQGKVTRDTEWDRKVFGKMQELVGGRLRYVVVGAAAVDVTALELARVGVEGVFGAGRLFELRPYTLSPQIVFGCPFIEIFGATETAGLASNTSATNPWTPYGSNVGRPYMYCDIVLRDVPALGYFATDKPYPRGEICLRAPSVTVGYYKEPQKTREMIGEDGYINMGDVAELLPDGTLRIIDRAKNVFKMNQGVFVAPEKIENVLMRSTWITQLYIHGELTQSFLVAFAVPDPDRVAAWAKSRGKTGGLEELCKDAELVEIVREEMGKVGRANGLNGYEIPRIVQLHPTGFSVEEGLVTPSLKNKREALKAKFIEEVKKMYAGGLPKM